MIPEILHKELETIGRFVFLLAGILTGIAVFLLTWKFVF